MIFHKCANLWCFLVVFCLCYFLETITFTYLVSAVQSVERQFQIPSTKSGTLIAASDIGYVLTVVVLAYMGSKGNRARWIGGGCVLISLACFLCSLPNFIFPNQERLYDHQFVVNALVPKYDDNFTYENSVKTNPFLLKNFENFIKSRNMTRSRGMKFNEIYMANTPGHKFKDPITVITLPKSVTTVKLPEPTSVYVYNSTVKAPPTTKSTPRLTSPKPTTVIASVQSSAKPKRPKFPLIEGSGDDTMEDMEKDEDVESLNVRKLAKRDTLEDKKLKFWTNFLMYANQSLTENATTEYLSLCNLPFTYCDLTVSKVKKAMVKAKCREQRTNNVAYGIVFVAISLIGVGHSMPWTLGMPLIDDNVKKQNTPFFFAGVFFLRIMGPVLGFLLGGWANKLYVTLKPPRGLTANDPGWIGAWWLGFLLIAIALFIPAVMLCCFPNIDKKAQQKKKLSKNRGVEEQGRKDQAGIPLQKQTFSEDKSYYDGNTLPVDELDPAFAVGPKKSLVGEIGSFFVSLGHCLMSPVYSGALVGRLFDAFAFKGFFAFQPKYLETHYGIPQYKVSFYMAVMGIVGFAGGVVLGSVIMKLGKLEGRRAATYVGMCSLISAALSFSEIFLGCTSINNQVGALGMPNNFTFPATCNSDCACDSSTLFPVCDSNSTPFFNPCFAGCTNPVLLDPKTFKYNYTQCSCANSEYVSRDFCKDDCSVPMTIYFVLSIISGVIGGSSVIPGILIVFRSVPEDLRSVALGFSGFIVSLLSTFPSPIVVGTIIDTTCILWDRPCGGTEGSCVLYDPTALRVRIHMFHGILRTSALLFDVWVWYWAKNLTLMEETKKDDGRTPDGRVIEAANTSMPNIKRNKKRSVIAEFVENFGSQYEVNMTGVGDNPPSDLGNRLSI